MQGWICLHRELIEKAIWTESTPEQKAILITLLILANHKEKEWEWQGEKYKARPGQFVTSLKSIAEKSGPGVSVQNVRTALSRFEKYEFLTNQSTNKNRLVTIVNWGLYQEKNSELTKQLTGSQQATNKQLTTNNNDNNDNNKKKSAKYSNEHLRLAIKLRDNLIVDFPNEAKKAKVETWANEIRLLEEKDNETIQGIDYVLDWLPSNDFWSGNIRSASKLRKQFEVLKKQIKAEKKPKQYPNEPTINKPDQIIVPKEHRV